VELLDHYLSALEVSAGVAGTMEHRAGNNRLDGTSCRLI
jgi:hypothetical protein